MKLSQHLRPLWTILLCTPLMLTSCSRNIVKGAPATESLIPTPTAAISFLGAETDTVAAPAGGLFGLSDGPRIPTPTPIASPPPPEIGSAVSSDTIKQSLFLEIPIYDEDLETNWTLENSSQVVFNPWDASHWFETLDKSQELDTGGTVIAVTPTADFSTLYFTVKSSAASRYLRSEIAGISFWVNSGNDFMDTDDLAVAVIGSNANPYWEREDFSALQNNQDAFSETRLYYLGVNRSIPPNTWVNVTIWLDDLMLDPDYDYLTGFYLKSDAGFQRTYYVDKVTLLALK